MYVINLETNFCGNENINGKAYEIYRNQQYTAHIPRPWLRNIIYGKISLIKNKVHKIFIDKLHKRYIHFNCFYPTKKYTSWWGTQRNTFQAYTHKFSQIKKLRRCHITWIIQGWNYGIDGISLLSHTDSLRELGIIRSICIENSFEILSFKFFTPHREKQ